MGGWGGGGQTHADFKGCCLRLDRGFASCANSCSSSSSVGCVKRWNWLDEAVLRTVDGSSTLAVAAGAKEAVVTSSSGAEDPCSTVCVAGDSGVTGVPGDEGSEPVLAEAMELARLRQLRCCAARDERMRSFTRDLPRLEDCRTRDR